ncbi:MAG: ABC transporter permease [Gammaproteobacteria bacterium]|nr:ABC transporter permease [Gammaproteobacteria bacterium]
MRQYAEKLGRATVSGLEELGYALSLFVESFYWIFFGYRRGQSVSIAATFKQMMQVGVAAIPISAALSFAVGIMLAIQGIHTLKAFGAESQVVVGIALSVTREFAPLIIGILIAGRSGSAIAARVGTMQVSQEIDALQVIGISPVRYLVAPALLAMMVMVPTLTFFADIVGMLGGAFFSVLELNISMEAYVDRTIKALTVDDILQGIWKSIVFAIIIAVVGFINGFSVTGGAEGVGKATTRSVVQAISLIIVADMAFTFYLNH